VKVLLLLKQVLPQQLVFARLVGVDQLQVMILNHVQSVLRENIKLVTMMVLVFLALLANPLLLLVQRALILVLVVMMTQLHLTQ
jgi:hypothetical protein